MKQVNEKQKKDSQASDVILSCWVSSASHPRGS